MRESVNELNTYDLVFLNGNKRLSKIYKYLKNINKNIKIFRGKYEPQNLNKINKKKNYLMFCGIGNPKEFENTLLENKIKIKKKIIFADHYKLKNKEVISIKKIAEKNNLDIITTEKDYFRLNSKQRKNVSFLKIELKINKLNELKKILLNIK